MQSDKDKQVRQINQLYEWITNNQKELDKMSKEELVVFMGPTGSGKSTIICNLIGIKLVSEKKNTSRIVKESPSTNEPIKRPKIGHQKQIACTVLPQCFEVKTQNYFLCDTAGFEDSRQNKQHIKILTDIFLHKTKKVKVIILIVTLACLQSNRGAAFRQLIKDVCSMFKVQQIKNKIIFVWNKTSPDNTLEDMYGQIQEMQAEAMELLSKNTGWSQEHLKMYQLIFQKETSQEPNNFQRFKNNNIVCSYQSLTSEDSTFTKDLLSMIRSFEGSESSITILHSQCRIAMTHYLNRCIIRRQFAISDCNNLYPYYRSYLVFTKKWKNFDKLNDQEKTNILNNSIHSSLQELDRELITINQMMIALGDTKEQLLGRLQVQVTEAMVDHNGFYHFNFDVGSKIFCPLKSSQYGQFYNEVIDMNKGIYKGSFKPDRQGKIATLKIQIRSCVKFQFETHLEIIKQKIQQRLKLKKLLSNSIFEGIHQISKDEGNTNQKKHQRLYDYLTKVWSSPLRMFKIIPTHQSLKQNEKQLEVLKYISFAPNGLIKSTHLDEFLKNNFFMPSSEEKKHLRCCLHGHMMKHPVQLNCGHFIELECLKQFSDSAKQSIVCQLCNKNVQVVEGKGQQSKQNLIQEEFEAHFDI